MFKLFGVIEEVESPINGKIRVVRDLQGIRIIAGGLSQSGWMLKSIWKSTIKKIQKKIDTPNNILILGLGGGSSAEIVSNTWKEAKIIGVDIDEKIVEMGKKYLSLSKIPNLNIVIDDVSSWINKKNKKFDLILVDLYIGEQIPKQFKKQIFFEKLKSLLTKKGVIAFNHLYSRKDRKNAEDFSKILRKTYPVIVNIFPEANVIFLCFNEDNN